MFLIYLVSFIVGGIFVGLSALGGIDGAEFDNDFDIDDFDMDIDFDVEISEYGDKDERSSLIKRRKRKFPRLPITSLKFWTFGFCFFGLTGLILSWLQPLGISAGVILAFAIGMGLICGTSIVTVLRTLQSNQANSLVESDDLAGLIGTVEIPFDNQSKGKIRINIKGSMIDLIAITEESKLFTRGEQVLVIGRENNKVWVVSQNTLSNDN